MPSGETCCQCQPFFDRYLLFPEWNWKMCQMGIVEMLKSVSGILSFNGCCCLSCRENGCKASTCSSCLLPTFGTFGTLGVVTGFSKVLWPLEKWLWATLLLLQSSQVQPLPTFYGACFLFVKSEHFSSAIKISFSTGIWQLNVNCRFFSFNFVVTRSSFFYNIKAIHFYNLLDQFW